MNISVMMNVIMYSATGLSTSRVCVCIVYLNA